MPKTNKTRIDLFEEKFIPEPNSGCWLWIAAQTSSGYGSFAIGNRVTMLAHRFSWIAWRGSIPLGMDICHTCDNPSCVNPDHLWMGTHGDNNKDRHAKGRSRGGSLLGELNSQAKITAKAVLEIRSRRKSRSAYAKQFGLHYGTVRDIEVGRIWKHVPMNANQRSLGDFR